MHQAVHLSQASTYLTFDRSITSAHAYNMNIHLANATIQSQ